MEDHEGNVVWRKRMERRGYNDLMNVSSRLHAVRQQIPMTPYPPVTNLRWCASIDSGQTTHLSHAMLELLLQKARPIRPLWHAIRHGHLETCRVLIDAGGMAADSRQQEVSTV